MGLFNVLKKGKTVRQENKTSKTVDQETPIQKKCCIVCGDPIEDLSSSPNLCSACQAKSAQQKEEFEKSDSTYRKDYYRYNNVLMAEKNMHRLFMVDSKGRGEYDSYRYDIYINTVTGIPYLKSWHISSYSFPPGTADVSGPWPISFYRLLEWAMSKSAETYEKYKGISKENWIDYIIDEI